MKVYINERAIEIFEGARVIDALHVFSVEEGFELPKSLPPVFDQYGNEVALDGMLSDGDKLMMTY